MGTSSPIRVKTRLQPIKLPTAHEAAGGRYHLPLSEGAGLGQQLVGLAEIGADRSRIGGRLCSSGEGGACVSSL